MKARDRFFTRVLDLGEIERFLMFFYMVADKCLNAKDRKGWAFGNRVLMDVREPGRALLVWASSTLLGAGLRWRLSPHFDRLSPREHSLGDEGHAAFGADDERPAFGIRADGVEGRSGCLAAGDAVRSRRQTVVEDEILGHNEEPLRCCGLHASLLTCGLGRFVFGFLPKCGEPFT